MGTPVQRRIPLIGIVGGIGSGKSSVANWVASHSRVAVIDADKLGHEALQAASVKESLIRRFGSDIVDSEGTLVRSSIARLVFGTSPEQVQARQDLESVVHPEIRRRILDSVSTATEAGYQAILLDAAILLETGWRSMCDLVVFIDTPDEIRLKRVRDNRGWSEADLRRREASQWSLQEKRRESDLVITNDRDVESAGCLLLDSLQRLGLIHSVQ